MPRFKPPSVGCSTGEPKLPAPQVLFWNPNCSIATAPASVTTARLTPRTRSAETPMISPISVATSEPASGPQGKPTPALADQARHDEAGHARQRHLRERHLTDVPDDHHHRQADHHPDQESISACR